MDLRVTTIFGGVGYGPQVNALQRRTDIVVATPGRLADLIGQGECDLSDVAVTVIDEADQMADLGFLPVVRRLLETTPDDGQRMLFSATLDAAVDVLARRFLHNPVLHSVDENSSPAEIEHHVLTVEPANRVAVLATLVGGEKRSLVFTRTKHGAERLARQLTQAGIPAAELHGNLRQNARSRNLAAFSSGLARVMVATDIAARGIHIDAIDLVIHADPPTEHKAYVHRSGRTARGGADGVVVTLQSRAQARDVTAMMRKADIAPHAAVAVDQDSDAVAEIAGPPAPRVSVSGKVSELVPPEDRLARNDQAGVGKPWEGRPRRDRNGDGGRGRKPRDERFRDRGPRDFAHRDGAAARNATSRPDERQVRADRSERPDRSSRFDRDERPARADHDRPRRFDGDSRPARSDRGDRFDQGNRNERFDRGDRRTDDGRTDDRRPDDRKPADRGLRGGNYRDPQGRQDNRGARGGNDWWPHSGGRPAQAGYRGPGSSWRSAGTGGQAGGGNRNRDDRGRDNGYRGERAPGGDRQSPGGGPSGDARSPRGERPFRDDRPARDERSGRDERPFRAARPQAGGGQAGGHPSGSSKRAGYSAGRGAAGKRRDTGQGRHF
jgi:superfamily II DNA/RNA helicase